MYVHWCKRGVKAIDKVERLALIPFWLQKAIRTTWEKILSHVPRELLVSCENQDIQSSVVCAVEEPGTNRWCTLMATTTIIHRFKWRNTRAYQCKRVVCHSKCHHTGSISWSTPPGQREGSRKRRQRRDKWILCLPSFLGLVSLGLRRTQLQRQRRGRNTEKERGECERTPKLCGALLSFSLGGRTVKEQINSTYSRSPVSTPETN